MGIDGHIYTVKYSSIGRIELSKSLLSIISMRVDIDICKSTKYSLNAKYSKNLIHRHTPPY